MKTLIFQHTEEEVPGTLSVWLENAGFPFHIHHLYRDNAIPDSGAYDWLIVLGGPMNLDEEDKYPWLGVEKKFIAEWLQSKKPFLGICLGGQLLAQALGAKVEKSEMREIGFHSISRTREEHSAFQRWPSSLRVFQWHEDRFDLPSGCQRLLTSEACTNQAFALGREVVGFQFHPESTESWIIGNFSGFEPRSGERYVQSKDQCVPLIPTLLSPMTKHFFDFLEDFTAEIKSVAE